MSCYVPLAWTGVLAGAETRRTADGDFAMTDGNIGNTVTPMATADAKKPFQRLTSSEIARRRREHRYHDGSTALTAKKIDRLKGPGRYRDGITDGLLLQITANHTKSWVLRYELNGVEKMMGLGPYPTVSLAKARERARERRLLLVDGIDPLQARRTAKIAARVAAAKRVTFAEAAATYLAEREADASWSNDKHAGQWKTTLATYVEPILGNIPVGEIDTTLVFKVLEQPVPAKHGAPAGTFWNTRRETASRVRGRIESILNWCTARQYRSGDNPAAWAVVGEVFKRGTLVEHHPSLPYAEMPAFMA